MELFGSHLFSYRLEGMAKRGSHGQIWRAKRSDGLAVAIKKREAESGFPLDRFEKEAQLFAEPNSRYKDAIEVGGLILCKTPVEFVGQRSEYFQKISDSQIDSVDNTYMRESDARMPLFNERRSTVTKGRAFGSGS